MMHFTTEEWIDFVNQMTPHKKQEAMRKHLGSGCKGCKEKFALWQKVRGTAASEANYQPPAEPGGGVKAGHPPAGIDATEEEPQSLAGVFFPSFLEAAVPGASSRAIGRD